MNLEELLTDPVKDKEFVDKLKNNKDKVRFLRAKKYTQDETASIIGINPRTVQRIEKSLRESMVDEESRGKENNCRI